MVVCNIVEEVDFFLLKKETSSDRVNWGIAPAFIEESSILVEGLEVVDVCL